MKLWYDKPACFWHEALPVGNGRIGGMVHGGIERELIQLNEDSIWSGKHLNRNNPDAKENLPGDSQADSGRQGGRSAAACYVCALRHTQFPAFLSDGG